MNAIPGRTLALYSSGEKNRTTNYMGEKKEKPIIFKVANSLVF